MGSEICNVVERTVKPDVLQPCFPTVFFLNLNSITGLFTVICNLTVVLSNDDQTKNRLPPDVEENNLQYFYFSLIPVKQIYLKNLKYLKQQPLF